MTNGRVIGSARTILVVEDERKVRELVRDVLTFQGFTVLEAAGGEEALALAGHHDGAIDLVITDVVMPALGGRQLVEALRGGRPRLRVLYISGYTADLLMQHGLLQEETAFLPKPFAVDALTGKVREILAAEGRARVPLPGPRGATG